MKGSEIIKWIEKHGVNNTYAMPKWQVSDIFGVAEDLELAMSKEIAESILDGLESNHSAVQGINNDVIESALESYQAECSSCTESFSLKDVRCSDGEVECSNCENS